MFLFFSFPLGLAIDSWSLGNILAVSVVERRSGYNQDIENEHLSRRGRIMEGGGTNQTGIHCTHIWKCHNEIPYTTIIN
jgi:hypothetical protein